METQSEAAFSKNRLGSEPVPLDLQLLLKHGLELYQRTGVSLGEGPDWTPWLDTSYLSEANRRDPDIIANIQAIAEVCSHIAFVAMHEDSEYIGYWRGPTRRPIADSPIVTLDNEGQFDLNAGPRLVEALLERTYDDESFSELRDWFESLGLVIPTTSGRKLAYPAEPYHPRKLHDTLFEKYRGGPSVA